LPLRQFADAGAQSTVSSPITNAQTTVTVASATGFPSIVSGGQLSVIIYDSGGLGYVAGASPFTVNYEYQPVDSIVGNVLTFGLGGGAASRAAYGGTTPKAYSAGATVAVVALAEDIVASAPWKFDDQTLSGSSVRIPASGSIPSSYLGISYRGLRIRWKVRTTSGNTVDTLGLTFNGDAGANYRLDVAKVEGGVATDPEATGQSSIQVSDVPGGSAAANLYASGFIEIPGAFDSFNKTLQIQSTGADSVLRMWAMAAIWFGTAPVASMGMALSAGSWATGSYVATELIP
jgi:hypothetical protein